VTSTSSIRRRHSRFRPATRPPGPRASGSPQRQWSVRLRRESAKPTRRRRWTDAGGDEQHDGARAHMQSLARRPPRVQESPLVNEIRLRFTCAPLPQTRSTPPCGRRCGTWPTSPCLSPRSPWTRCRAIGITALSRRNRRSEGTGAGRASGAHRPAHPLGTGSGRRDRGAACAGAAAS
jgi:hypothetical protein